MSLKKLLLSFFLTAIPIAHAHTSIEQISNWVTISNAKNTLSFNLSDGFYYMLDEKGEKAIDYAYFQLGALHSKDKEATRTYSAADVNDDLGTGKCLTVNVNFQNDVNIIWQVFMYDDAPYVVFNMGVENDTRQDYRLAVFHPLTSRSSYAGNDNTDHFKALDGHGGGARTLVSDNTGIGSFNNLLFRFGTGNALRIFVAGGLTYKEFEKFVTVNRQNKKMCVDIYAEDPVGKGVPAGSRYLPDERFYVCLNNPNPFEALELYGKTLKTAQAIKLNYYDFPTECLWYASFYNRDKNRPRFNDSKGAVEEMNRAIQSGVTRYTRVAIRLVPDAYGPDNQQGWWDDEHWARYGEPMSSEGPHYVAPYLTTKSWAGEILSKGGIPITYFQGTRRSEDYAKEHPDHMLFNTVRKVMNQPERLRYKVTPGPEYGDTNQFELSGGYYSHWWTDKMVWSYDLTDPGFVQHMQDVYRNLHDAGIAGIMYDYPDLTGWAYEGGFEDKNATTAHAYREIYRLAYEGLGDKCYLDERNLLRGSDITLGLVASQRVWADTDIITPEMVTRCGLRWYKNRVVVNYDMDAKDPVNVAPLENRDGNKAMLTMCYVTSGRFLMGRGFAQLSPEEMRDFSRTFPYHTSPQSARPLDAFHSRDNFCRVYDFAVTPDWHQLTFYNPDTQKPDTLSIALGASLNEGGMELAPQASYHVYDFWNDCYMGLIQGTDVLTQTLRPGEARMLSIRKKQTVPQYLSTNRHLMQGYVDMKSCTWDKSQHKLKGCSLVVANEPYEIIVATNGMAPNKAEAEGADITINSIPGHKDLIKLILTSSRGGETTWNLSFNS